MNTASYFNNAKITCTVSLKIHADAFNRLIEFIENLDVPLEHIRDNL